MSNSSGLVGSMRSVGQVCGLDQAQRLAQCAAASQRQSGIGAACSTTLNWPHTLHEECTSNQLPMLHALHAADWPMYCIQHHRGGLLLHCMQHVPAPTCGACLGCILHAVSMPDWPCVIAQVLRPICGCESDMPQIQHAGQAPRTGFMRRVSTRGWVCHVLHVVHGAGPRPTDNTTCQVIGPHRPDPTHKPCLWQPRFKSTPLSSWGLRNTTAHLKNSRNKRKKIALIFLKGINKTTQWFSGGEKWHWVKHEFNTTTLFVQSRRESVWFIDFCVHARMKEQHLQWTRALLPPGRIEMVFKCSTMGRNQ